jgi:hypothetical protein
MAEFRKSYRADVGLNHVPAYQVSGRPFATGSVDVAGQTSLQLMLAALLAMAKVKFMI